MAEQQVQKQHPIPQQVLGIQFKLIGDLTLRQFVILALFGGLAYVIFSLPNVNPLIKVPLAGITFLLGVAFGLVPIQDQPLDRWLAYFFRATYSPTRRVWRKIPEPPEFLVVPIPKLVRTVEEGISSEEARKRLEEYLATIKEEALSPLDLAEKQQLEFLNLELRETALEAKLPPPPPRKPPLPKRRFEEVKEKPSLASTINYAVEPVLKLQKGKEVTYVTALRNVRVGRRLTYAPTAEVVFAPARERVIEPTLPSPPTIEPVTTEAPRRPEAPKEVKPPPPPPKVEKRAPPKKIEPKPPPPPVGKPNSINGTVYDKKGGTVEGALIAIKNRAGVTIRAIKTNQLGQFSFSPLPNGIYTVELPKAKLPFGIMRVELTGVVVSPLEIKA